MKIIIYTPEDAVKDEVSVVSELLDAGADYLYIRKPNLDDFSLVDYMEQFNPVYYPKMITTSLIITKEFDLAGYHFTRDILQKNERYNEKVLEWLHVNGKLSSASAHSIDEVKKYAGVFSHLIVSPVFASISKQGHIYSWDYSELGNTILNLKSPISNLKSTFFAVGGVDEYKLTEIASMHFDGIGLMGALWKSPQDALKLVESIQVDR